MSVSERESGNQKSGVPASAVALDYDKIYAEYQAGLVDKLRGFGPANESLSLWVPDENATLSIRNMLDAASSVGQSEICIRLGVDFRTAVERTKLEQIATRFGSATLSEENDEWLLTVKQLHEGAPEENHEKATAKFVSHEAVLAQSPIAATGAENTGDSAHGFYDKALKTHAATAKFLSFAPATGDLTEHDVLLQSLHGDLKLWTVVDRRTHVVTRVGYSGTGDAEVMGVLESTSSQIQGLPLQEAADHGVLRSEFKLRPERDQRPVSGILLADKVHPAFAAVQLQLRELRSQYASITGFSSIDNTYDCGVGEDWKQLDASDRTSEVNDQFRAFEKATDMECNSIELLDIQFDVRVVAGLKPTVPLEGRAQMALALERHLKDHVDPRLELYLEELKDNNKLRRLSVVQSNG